MMTGTARYLYTKASNTRYTQDLRYTQGSCRRAKYEYQDRSTTWGTVGVSRIEHGPIRQRGSSGHGSHPPGPVTAFSVQTARNWVDDPIYITRRKTGMSRA